jgi:heat-inducible transcriptional repressor
LLELLERRRALLDVLAESLDPRRPFVRVGVEISNPALHELALVGAAYGLSNRTLGVVSLVGPVRMDYDKAIRSVRGAASELSRFSEELFGEN